MGRNLRYLSFVAILAVLCAGCPVDPGAGLEPTPGSGSSAAPSGGSSGGGGGTGQGTQSFDAQLAEQFPTCIEPPRGDAWRDEILHLVNIERGRAGLSPVTHDQTLEDLAIQYTCEMIHYDFFDHTNPVTGTQLPDRAEDFGYDYLVIGENLAAGQTSPAQVMAEWMDSDRHRDNILEPDFTELGVGVRTGGAYGTYWVQEFGRPVGP